MAERQVVVVGLGYVGLPVACTFAKLRPVIGFDVNPKRVDELAEGRDHNDDVEPTLLNQPSLTFTSDPSKLPAGDVFIVAVPTPVDRSKRPDLRYLLSASETVGRALAARESDRPSSAPATVIFESTVYPGCTEEVCRPALARASGLAPSTGFRLAYSPERINPGDREHTLETITKIVAGQDEDTLAEVAALYETVVRAGVHRARDIRTAEAAKIIENTQRDLNIALMNEFAMLFHRMGVDTNEVLAAAGSKWNFLPFQPGLVGGHCIPEDPYYLTFKAAEVGHHPQLILAGRRINDGMGRYVAHETVKALTRTGIRLPGARVGVLGLTFKENVRDIRNSRVPEMIDELLQYGCLVTAHDPCLEQEPENWLPASTIYSERLEAALQDQDVIVLAVPHTGLARAVEEALSSETCIRLVVDIKGVLDDEVLTSRGIDVWRL